MADDKDLVILYCQGDSQLCGAIVDTTAATPSLINSVSITASTISGQASPDAYFDDNDPEGRLHVLMLNADCNWASFSFGPVLTYVEMEIAADTSRPPGPLRSLQGSIVNDAGQAYSITQDPNGPMLQIYQNWQLAPDGQPTTGFLYEVPSPAAPPTWKPLTWQSMPASGPYYPIFLKVQPSEAPSSIMYTISRDYTIAMPETYDMAWISHESLTASQTNNQVNWSYQSLTIPSSSWAQITNAQRACAVYLQDLNVIRLIALTYTTFETADIPLDSIGLPATGKPITAATFQSALPSDPTCNLNAIVYGDDIWMTITISYQLYLMRAPIDPSGFIRVDLFPTGITLGSSTDPVGTAPGMVMARKGWLDPPRATNKA